MITSEQQIYSGPPSGFSCPECHGSLWQVDDGKLVRFRCRIGHAYTLDTMLAEQQETLERGLSIASRILEERIELCQRMEQRALKRGTQGVATRYHQRAEQAQEQLGSLRELLDQCIEQSQIKSVR